MFCIDTNVHNKFCFTASTTQIDICYEKKTKSSNLFPLERSPLLFYFERLHRNSIWYSNFWFAGFFYFYTTNSDFLFALKNCFPHIVWHLNLINNLCQSLYQWQNAKALETWNEIFSPFRFSTFVTSLADIVWEKHNVDVISPG